jgi:hypothetical protein
VIRGNRQSDENVRVRQIDNFVFVNNLQTESVGILNLMSTLIGKIAEYTRWTIFYGPVLSLVPARWRVGRFGDRYANWPTGTMLSGGFECILAVNFFCAWGFLPVTTNLLLWIGMYFLTDGAWRTAIAVFNGEAAGTVLLELVAEAGVVGWRAAWTLRHAAVNDLVTADETRDDWQLKIESSRAKKDWDVARMILYNERYYRIESLARIEGARPFVYLLRSLPAGVPSLRVFRYTPNETAKVPKF